jgi:type I restriction enzyme S subunit
MRDWIDNSVDDMVAFHRGITWAGAQEVPAEYPNAVPVLRIPNIQDHLDTSDMMYLKGISDSQKRQFAATKSWLLMVGSNGNPERIGNCVLVRADNQYLFASFLVGAESRDPREYDPEYLFHLFRSASIQKTIIDSIQGSTGLRNINLKRVRAHRLLRPPAPVQRRIAKILTTVDSQIEKTEALIAKYQSIKQGLMHDLFTRGVDEHGRLRPTRDEAPQLYKESELGWIPTDWEIKRVDDLGDVRLGRQRSPKHQSGRFTTPYLRVANVFDGWFALSDVLEMDFTPTERATYSVEVDDIFLNEGQSLELVGRSARFNGPAGVYCFQNTLVRFRVNGENVARFWEGVFKFWLDTGRFQTVARQTTSVAHLGADRFARMMAARPLKAEQVRIAARLDSNCRFIASEQARLAKLRNIKLGLMQDLLTGKVPVKPGHSDLDNGVTSNGAAKAGMKSRAEGVHV